MSRISLFSAPFLLGFDTLEARVDRMAKNADGYPPYNIERVGDASADDGANSCAENYLITIAVAGFSADELDIQREDNQLVVRGRQSADPDKEFLHRGIATRQFQRSFLLADGMKVEGAQLKDGMLIISVQRPRKESVSRRIEIQTA